MKLNDFSHQYKLTDEAEGKLNAIQIAGPQFILLVSDADLHGDGRLSVGELASVHDAQK